MENVNDKLNLVQGIKLMENEVNLKLKEEWYNLIVNYTSGEKEKETWEGLKRLCQILGSKFGLNEEEENSITNGENDADMYFELYHDEIAKLIDLENDYSGLVGQMVNEMELALSLCHIDIDEVGKMIDEIGNDLWNMALLKKIWNRVKSGITIYDEPCYIRHAIDRIDILLKNYTPVIFEIDKGNVLGQMLYVYMNHSRYKLMAKIVINDTSLVRVLKHGQKLNLVFYNDDKGERERIIEFFKWYNKEFNSNILCIEREVHGIIFIEIGNGYVSHRLFDNDYILKYDEQVIYPYKCLEGEGTLLSDMIKGYGLNYLYDISIGLLWKTVIVLFYDYCRLNKGKVIYLGEACEGGYYYYLNPEEWLKMIHCGETDKGYEYLYDIFYLCGNIIKSEEKGKDKCSFPILDIIEQGYDEEYLEEIL
jgi:hypothetical protein